MNQILFKSISPWFYVFHDMEILIGVRFVPGYPKKNDARFLSHGMCETQCISQDWGSMIGEITLGEAEFFSDLWRTATDPNWGKDPGLNMGHEHGIEGDCSWDSVGFEWDFYIKMFIGLNGFEWIFSWDVHWICDQKCDIWVCLRLGKWIAEINRSCGDSMVGKSQFVVFFNGDSKSY